MSIYKDDCNSFSDDSVCLPIMSLREVVMFPRSITPLFVGREASINSIEEAILNYDKKIFLVAQRNPETERPGADELFSVGTVSKILQMLKLPDGTIKVLFEGLYRAKWDHNSPLLFKRRGRQDNCLDDEASDESDNLYEYVESKLVQVVRVEEKEIYGAEAAALVRSVHELLEKFSRTNKKIAPETILAISSLNEPGRLADAIMPHLKVDYVKKQEILEEEDSLKRLDMTMAFLQSEIEVFSIEKKIKNRVKQQMEKNQKEYYLNEQLKAIHKEMGREEDPLAEVADFEAKLEEKDLPEEARERVLREMRKMRQTPPSSAEYTVVRNYVEWILDLPWNLLQESTLDVTQAEVILEEDHFGLEKPKERILEYLAVHSLVGQIKGPVLCLVGPPGVGKTSLAKSIARAMGRQFVRLSLGGVRDEAEIRGHRRTYVGALPGKIIQSMRKVKFNNPVVCLDEVDKMSTDFRGDPSSALLEVLDPEQNYAFVDHYLDLDYDLSKTFFITTANSLHGIPLPLQDRMEIIRIPGYLETEKMHIAKDFLLPKQVSQNGLATFSPQFSDNAILEIIRHYTRESGVRNLEREIASICRKIARKIVEKKDDADKLVSITKQNIGSYLGVPKHRHGEREEKPQVGVATGMAWTEMGGELLVVEIALMPGSGKVEITGKLGEVMQESARAALSYIRSRSEVFGLRPDFHKEIDIHIHVPEGAIPKDGPSAGITLATALVSALMNMPVRNDLAMTGEITLRGRVLPIGGLREKLLAAHRGLITHVIIPVENEKDLREVPEAILKDLEVLPVESMDQVLEAALVHTDSASIFQGRSSVEAPLSRGLMKEEFQGPYSATQ